MTENERLTINGKEVTLYREKETNLYRFSKDAVDMLLEALEEREQYRAIGTVEKCEKAMDFELAKQDKMLAEVIDDYLKFIKIGTIEEFKALKENQCKCEDCAGCTNWKCDCANERAYAIDEFAERLKKKNYDGKLSCFGWHEFIDKEIDEIAEEMKAAYKKENGKELYNC